MNVSSLANVALSSLQSTQASSPLSSAAAAALQRASDRVGQQLNSTQVKLSAYGQVKNAFADVQTAGKALADVNTTTPAADVKKAAQAFVAAFNKANSTVATTTQTQGTQAGALANDTRATEAGEGLRRSVAEGGAAANLAGMGITQNKDGSLSFDEKAFDKAAQENPGQVAGALASVGKQVEKQAGQELASNGNVGASTSTLEKQQRDQQAQTAVVQQLIQNNSNVAQGVAAYLQQTLRG